MVLLVIVRGVRQGDAPVTSVEVTNEAVNLEKSRSAQATSTAALVGERHTYEQVVVVVVVAIQAEEDAILEVVRNPPVVSIRVVAEVEAGFQDKDNRPEVGEHEYPGASAQAVVVVCISVVVLPHWP